MHSAWASALPFLIAVNALVFVRSTPAQETPFTLKQVMSAPFPSDLVGAGNSFAWVVNDEGIRNIFAATAPEYSTRQLTPYTKDDGQALGSLVFNATGDTLVFVRGGNPNRKGTIPNPAHNPESAEQAIWRIGPKEPVKLAEGSNPVIHAGVVAFTRNGAAYSVPLSGHNEQERLFAARGSTSSLRWSPDGSMLAFVSLRGTHALIGIYDIVSNTVRFLAPSSDSDSNPTWSPDGRQIAFLRRSASSRRSLFVPVMDGQPWSIIVVDVDQGHATTVWRADEGPGSVFRGIAASNQLFWASGDHIVFPWERSGWTHLYRVSAAGGTAMQLTDGPFEVEEVTLSADRKHAIYTSNQDDPHRRHMWTVAVDGSDHARLTLESGIEWSPTINDHELAFIGAGATEPARVFLHGAAHRPLMEATDFPAPLLVEPQSVDITAADGLIVPGQLFLPHDIPPGEQRPAVVFLHGGSRRQMLLGWHYRGYYNKAYALNQYLTGMGMVVLSVNYRSGTGYGLEFREAANYGRAGGSEFFDVLGAGLYLKNRSDVAPDKIGLWGGSYGGYLTALGLARASNLFAAGVDIHGVHDWNLGIQNFDPSYEPLEDPDGARTAFDASPMAHLDDWRSPVLVIHGDDDRNVAFKETVLLVEALRARGVYVEQLVFPDEVHNFLLHRSWVEAYDASANFLRRMFEW